MSSRKRTGTVPDLTTRVLIEIREEMRGMRDEIRITNVRLETGFAEVNGRLDQTNNRLDQTNARLENLRDIAGERYRELDARIRALETRIGP